jgi:glycosyltransferase involved in cell wall biosynthesis
MANENLKVSVVLCAYTRERWLELENAIQSLQRQTVEPAEIILVIDHNPALHKLAKETFTDVKVLENQEARGLSGARNTGIIHSTGQVIAFIDEDAYASSDWIESLLRSYQDAHVVGVGGKVEPVWDVTPPDWLPEEFNWVVGCSYKGLPETLAPVRNPIGCNMSFRREVLMEAGGFRNGIGRIGKTPVGCEETELSIRARQLNPSSVYLYQPASVVFHRVPEWRLRKSYFAHRCYSEGLSKAQVTESVGSNDGLSTERRYVTHTLPNGVLTGLRDFLFHRQLAGLKRAGVTVGGLFLTTIGYLVGVASRLRQKFLATLARPRISSETKGT